MLLAIIKVKLHQTYLATQSKIRLLLTQLPNNGTATSGVWWFVVGVSFCYESHLLEK